MFCPWISMQLRLHSCPVWAIGRSSLYLKVQRPDLLAQLGRYNMPSWHCSILQHIAARVALTLDIPGHWGLMPWWCWSPSPQWPQWHSWDVSLGSLGRRGDVVEVSHHLAFRSFVGSLWWNWSCWKHAALCLPLGCMKNCICSIQTIKKPLILSANSHPEKDVMDLVSAVLHSTGELQLIWSSTCVVIPAAQATTIVSPASGVDGHLDQLGSVNMISKYDQLRLQSKWGKPTI